MAEALAGHPVFTGDSGLALCMAQLSDAPVPLPPSVVASPLGRVIARATQKSPAARFTSAGEMLAQLEAVVATFSGPAPGAVVPPDARGPMTFSAPAATGARAASVPPPPPSSASPASLVTVPLARPSAVPILAAPPASLVMPPMPPTPLVGPPPRMVGPPPASAAAPATTRRNLLLAGVAGGVVILATLAAVAVRPVRTLLGERERGAKPPAGSLGPPVARRFGQLTPVADPRPDRGRQPPRRMESTSEFMTIWLLQPHMDTMMVQLARFPDAQRADAVFKMWKTKGNPVARDGNAVLCVAMPQQAAAEALLNRILR